MKKIIIIIVAFYLLTDLKNLLNLYSIDKILFDSMGILPLFYLLAIGSIVFGLMVLLNLYLKKLNQSLVFRNYFVYQIFSSLVFFGIAFIDIQKTNEVLKLVSSLKTDNIDKVNFMTVQILIPGFIFVIVFNLIILYALKRKKYFL